MKIANLKTPLDLAKKGVPKFTEYKVAEDSTKTVQARADQMGIYFFHPDHLGSSTFLTDGMGNPYQIEAEPSSLKHYKQNRRDSANTYNNKRRVS